MDFQTREDICCYMVELLNFSTGRILEPTPGKGNIVRVLQDRGFEVEDPEDFWQLDFSRRFDGVVMNPPFTPMKVGYRILDLCLEMSSHVIALMPWLTLINSVNRTNKLKEFGLRSVTHLPRNIFPGARVQCCILQLDKNYTGKTNLEFY